MKNLREWQTINEALQGNMPLGLSRPHTVGGVMGTHVSEGGFPAKNDDDDFDEDDDDDDDFDGDEEDDEGLEGDLIGSSSEDEGPDKGWPPEDGPEDFGDEEGDDDFLASIGAGAGGTDVGDMGGLEDLEGTSGALAGDMDQGSDEPDMSFLDDLPPDLLGGEMGGMGPEMGDEVGGAEMPCPDCNPEGEHEIGEEGCVSCNGEGFVADEMGGLEGEESGDGLDDLESDLDVDVASSGVTPDDKMSSFMNNMTRYMQKYMKKEATDIQEYAPAAPMPQPAGYSQITPQQMQMQQRQGMMQPAPQPPRTMGQPPMDQQQMRKKMVKFMSKKGERSFMATDAPRNYMKKDSKAEKCCTEGDDFFTSLIKHSARQDRGRSGISEDALFDLADPTAEYAKNDPKPGEYGFSPQGRVGSIGGGYTKNDFEDLPVLGESIKFPTLTEFAIRKARAASKHHK